MSMRLAKVLNQMQQVDNTQTRLDTQALKDKWRKSIDVDELNKLLAHHHHELRANVKKALDTDPIFLPKYNMSLHEERELALARLKKICGTNTFSVRAFMPGRDPREIFAAHEL